jgi:hypothetical protein
VPCMEKSGELVTIDNPTLFAYLAILRKLILLRPSERCGYGSENVQASPRDSWRKLGNSSHQSYHSRREALGRLRGRSSLAEAIPRLGWCNWCSGYVQNGQQTGFTAETCFSSISNDFEADFESEACVEGERSHLTKPCP